MTWAYGRSPLSVLRCSTGDALYMSISLFLIDRQIVILFRSLPIPASGDLQTGVLQTTID